MDRIKNKQKTKFFRIVFYAVLFLIVFFYLFFNIGLGLIIKTSAFISNFLNKKNNESISNNEIKQEVALIDINNIPYATNSADFLVSGSILNLDILEFFLNEQKIKEVVTKSDTFEEIIGKLIKGDNLFYIIGKNEKDKIIKKSKVYHILYKPDKPKLEIKEPQDRLTTSNSEIKIAGETDKETFIKINDLPVVVDALGNFSTTIRLKEGENQIKITAEDQAGNIEEKVVTVLYQKEN